jgi:T5orf172 domain
MGYVYLLTNRSMPGIVKIGSSERNPVERAAELFTTGVASPFSVRRVWTVYSSRLVEQQLHRELNQFRVSRSREFFRLSPAKAEVLISSFVGGSGEIASEPTLGEECSMLKCNSKASVVYLGRFLCIACSGRVRRKLRGVPDVVRLDFIAKNFKRL